VKINIDTSWEAARREEKMFITFSEGSERAEIVGGEKVT
jgi:hypothetical protein